MYDRDCRPLHSADADTTRSSALDATSVRILNNTPALQRSEVTVGGSEVSPGSARLEKLRQRQTDDKLEKLKERIRRQREQLEEAAGRGTERQIEAGQGQSAHQHVTKVRKVAAAPPAPNYKGNHGNTLLCSNLQVQLFMVFTTKATPTNYINYKSHAW